MSNVERLTVEKLKKLLSDYPDDMEIIYDRCSDYEDMDECSIFVVKAVRNDSGWLMRSHPTMSAENKASEKEYLHFPGN